MVPVQTTPGIRGGKMKENGWGGESCMIYLTLPQCPPTHNNNKGKNRKGKSKKTKTRLKKIYREITTSWVLVQYQRRITIIIWKGC
jgi:hypothetical protein